MSASFIVMCRESKKKKTLNNLILTEVLQKVFFCRSPHNLCKNGDQYTRANIKAEIFMEVLLFWLKFLVFFIPSNLANV